MNNNILLDVSSMIASFTLFDDTFMSKAFEDKECATLLLNTIHNRDDIILVKNSTQHTITNLHGHSSRVDMLASDSYNHTYNAEVQVSNSGGSPERARYYGGLLDADILPSGKDYIKLPEIDVIFICKNDVLGYGLPIYHIDRKINENNEPFKDKSHIIYVNGKHQDNTPLGRLMHDFHCKNPEDMYYDVLRKRVKYLKQGDGKREMCKLVEDYAKAYAENEREIGKKIGKEIGKEIGKNQGLANAIISILKKKFGSLTPNIIIEIKTSPTYKLEQLIIDILDAKSENDVQQMLINR